MNSNFYPKFAISNIKKNSKHYIPYIITCITTMAMYYIMVDISKQSGLDNFFGSDSLKIILSLGAYVIGIFSAIFLFYTNSFLIKNRKKEFGVLNILGMEKKHILKIIFCETIYVFFIIFILGIISGLVFSKLLYMVLLKLLKFDVSLGFGISTEGIIKSLALFSGIFLANFVNSLIHIYVYKPIELIKGGQVGEREPKVKILLVIISFICLVGAYYIAQTTKSPMESLNLFFVAVLMVIVGTYCLFVSGIIAFLKVLKKNKSYFYKTKNFISISSMMYRMKQNAVGLANICILSTVVLIMISGTISLYCGIEDILKTLYPRDYTITDYVYKKDSNLLEMLNSELKKYNGNIEKLIDYKYQYMSMQSNDEQNFIKSETNINSLNFMITTIEDYNSIQNKNETLKENEVFIISKNNNYKNQRIYILGEEFIVKNADQELKDFDLLEKNYYRDYDVIIKDINVFEKLNKLYSKENIDNVNPIRYKIEFDSNINHETFQMISENIYQKFESENREYNLQFQSIHEESDVIYSLYGGLLFIGIFLGVLFIVSTVLIIYYKQISEGYDDKDRFKILKKVGMSTDEIKGTIKKQVMTVFFLPVIVAFIHTAFAFEIVTNLLEILYLTNVKLFATCSIATFIIYVVLYTIVYFQTAKSYYKIVNES